MLSSTDYVVLTRESAHEGNQYEVCAWYRVGEANAGIRICLRSDCKFYVRKRADRPGELAKVPTFAGPLDTWELAALAYELLLGSEYADQK